MSDLYFQGVISHFLIEIGYERDFFMKFDKRLPQSIIPEPFDGGTPEERERFLKYIPWNLRVIKPRKCIEIKTLIYACDKIRPPWYSPKGDVHDFWEFLLIIKGTAEVEAGQDKFILTDGMMIAHSPMELHSLKECAGEELEFMIAAGEFVGEDMEYFKENRVFNLSQGELSDYMTAVSALHMYYSGMGDIKYLQKGINRFEAFIIDMLITAEAKKHAENDVRFAEIIEALNRMVEEKLTLSRLSQECGMSISLMKKIFQRNSDCGIMSYFSKIKIRRATELLDQGYGVSDVAKRLSYSGTEYFLYCFRREMGITPRQYIKRKTD